MSLVSLMTLDLVYGEPDDFGFVELNDSYFLGDKITIKFEKITQQPCPSYEISMMKEGFPESMINVGVEPLCATIGHVELYLFSDYLERFEFFNSVGTYIIKVKLDDEIIQKEIEIIDNKNTSLKKLDGFFTVDEKQVRYVIPYTISNGTINDMTLYCKHASFLVKITPQTESNGILVLDFPRSIMDPKTNDEDRRFVVLRDGEQIDYDEIPYQDHRRLSMLFTPHTDEIEIVSSVIPELKSPTCKIADNPPYSLILSPLKQFKSGISVDEIQCRESLILVTKHDGSPACIKTESISRLDEREWTDTQNVTKANPTENNILRYSPVLFKGSGVILDKSEFTAEDFQQIQQRKTELEMLLEDKSIAEEIRDDMREESRMIRSYSQQAFDENVSFELITVLWEKRIHLREFLSTHTREDVFPIACTAGISVGYHAYSVDEEYVGNPVALIISVPEEHFTKSNLQKADDIVREQIGVEIDVVYNKSDCYAVALSESTG